MIASHAIFILFLFALGACIGSFLNVVIWRLPQIEHDPNDRSIFGPMLRTIEGLSNPPSHCPRCKRPLKWYDTDHVFNDEARQERMDWLVRVLGL